MIKIRAIKRRVCLCVCVCSWTHYLSRIIAVGKCSTVQSGDMSGVYRYIRRLNVRSHHPQFAGATAAVTSRLDAARTLNADEGRRLRQGRLNAARSGPGPVWRHRPALVLLVTSLGPSLSACTAETTHLHTHNGSDNVILYGFLFVKWVSE